MPKKANLIDLAYRKKLVLAGLGLLTAIINLLSKVVNYASRVPQLRIQIP